MKPHSFLLVALLALAGCPAPGPTPPDDGGVDGNMGCASDTNCAGNTPRCDKNTSMCVPCLPINDNCPNGAHCVPLNGSYACSVTCAADVDCPKSDAGAQLACCNTACIDTSADTRNCGACGKTCDFPNASAACVNGLCVPTGCKPGFSDCDNVAANGCEVATGTDSKNCGSCGHACAGLNSMQGCQGGVCAVTGCTAGFADCDGKPDTGCEAPVSSDPMNCGGCGKACPAPPNSIATCTNGQCGLGPCKPGWADCNMQAMDGCEADLTSLQTCGKCGVSCAMLANASAACNMGMCGIGMCNPNFADCDKSAANGCEKSVATDPNNCGGCGKVCILTNATPVCKNGSCSIAACFANFSDCDMNPANGCEALTGADPFNCGGCGKACPVPQNAVPTCANSTCGAQCAGGFADCNKNLADGCEVSVATDPNNCNACGNACPAVPNGAAACKMGVCGIGMCNANFADCDMQAQNGCEKNLTNDPANCGKCGAACAISNAQSQCQNGTCSFVQCNPGFADCNGMKQDGCEVNTQSDAANCGQCGIVCPMNNPVCSNSACTSDDFPPIWFYYYTVDQ